MANPDVVQPTPTQPVTTDKTNAPVTPDVPSQKAPDDMSAKFAALAKKERITRANAQRTKQLETQLAERERKIADRERQWEEEFRASPLDALKRRGIQYEDITKAALNDGKFDPSTEVKSVKEELKTLRQEQADKEKRAAEDQENLRRQQEAQAVEGFNKSIVDHVESNKDKFELVALYEAHGLVYQTVEEHFLRTKKAGNPKILSIDEACEQVEKYLESEVDRMATSSKKFQAKYSSQKDKDGDGGKPAPKSTTTITNDLNTSAAPSLLPASTENDRLKRALAALG